VRRSRFVRGRDAYTSICAPMMTVRSRGRANCSAPSAAMEEVAGASAEHSAILMTGEPRVWFSAWT
jgi:hypothetical protein